MGVRNKTVKRASKKIIERYYQRLTLDFSTNKRIVDEVAMIPSKRLRNKIAGFASHMMKRISAVDIMIADGIEIDTDTREMLSSMDMQNLQGLNVVNSKDQGRRGYGDRPRGDRPRSDRPRN